ncbi:MAG: hypothetical protein QOI10_437, partial [Solirubrobacterales bacterium]|nr:hypothetical protein [Solirubrobacterales bacterium]
RSVRIRTTDNGAPNRNFEKAFTINVTNANDTPTDIALSNSSVAENTAQGTDVGNLSTTDQDTADTFTYTLVAGAGSTDNGDFQINGSTLEVKNPLNFEAGATRSVRIRTTDNGTGNLTFEKPFSITITNVNDAPTDIALNDTTTVEHSPQGTGIGTFSTTDEDTPAQTFTYSFATGNGINDADNGKFQITGNQLEHNATDLSVGTYSIFVRSTDSGSPAEHFDKQFTITVNPPNAAPVVDLDSATGGNDSTASFTEDSPAVSIEPNATVTDADNANLQSAEVKITNLQNGASESLSATVGGTGINATYTPGTGTLALTNTATVAQYEQVLKTVKYDNTSNTPGTTARAIEVKAFDGIDNSITHTATVSVAANNDAPVNSVPGAQTTNEDTSKTLSTANANAISISDVDAGGSDVKLTLSVSNGTLTLADTTGLTFTGGTANGQASLIFTGTISAINAALGNGLTYQPNANFNTSDTLAVTTDDQGNTGGGGAKTDSDNVTLNITADNDAPNTTVPGAQSVDEDTDLTFNTANSNLISTVDVDANPDDIRVTLAATNGKMTLATTAGLTPPINDGTSNVTVEGTVAEVNAALDGMKYRGNLNYFGSDTLSVNTTDLGHNPAPAKTDSDSVAITVNPVNDAPVADDENFNGANSAVGNTTFVGNSPGDGAPSTPDPTDTSPVTDRPHKTISGDILAGDTDVDDPTSSLTVSSGTVSSANAPGTNNVTIEPDGDFTFEPEPSASCTDPTDSFDYTVSDGHLGTTDTGTVTIALSGCVWYVNNDDAQGDGGTSEKPFNTLAQAETASGNNHSTFVYDGNNTSSGYDTGITLNSGEKLIGEAADLIAGTPAATLHSADAANRPTLTDTTADVVELDDGNEVKGLGIDPEGGGGIFGGSGDVAGTIDDVVINDAGIAATQPGLELNTTTGTWNISNLDVDVKNGATGVQLLNAGTVNFAPSGTISISSIGGKALGASSTNMGAGSEFDDLTATGSSAGGVTMTSTSGTTSLGNGSANDLALATTGGTAAALELTNAGTVNVPGAGTSNLSATNAGPAIDVQGTTVTALSFDDVDSSNSASDGIRLSGLGTGTFAANSSSTIDGASGAAVNVSGGSGAITFPGTINNGPGTTASISGRTGGSVTLSGPITETGDADAAQENGGVVLSGNSGGSTDITNATKTFNTGEDHAILMGTSDGHTLNITNGTLDIDTTSGKGIEATTSGTLNVTGSGNTIDTGSGKGLNVTNTDVGAANPLTFQSISGNGANAGILLNNTGSNNALTVVSTGSGTCDPTGTSGCTGGTITNTTGGDDSGSTPVGTAVVLKDTKGVSLTRVHLSNNSNYGIRGTTVNGLTLANTVINGTNGTSALTANKDSSSRFDNLTGTVSVTNTEMSGGYVSNFLVNNTAGSLSSTMTNFKSGTLDATGGDDAVQVEGLGTASVDVTMTGSTITTATGDLFQYDADGTGGGDLVFTGNALTNNEPSIAVGGGGVALTGGATGPATLDIENSSFRDSLTNAITIIKSRDNSGGSGNFSGTINNNQIGVAATPNSGSVEGDGMEITNEGHGNMTLAITNNIIRQYNSSGMQFVAGGGIADTGQFNLNISGNTIGNPGTTPTITLLQGIRIDSGVTAGDTFATCANFGANAITGSSDAANKDFRLVVNQNTTIRLPGYGGAATDGAAVAAFVAGKVGGGAQGTAVANAPGTFTGTGATCP